MPKKRPTAAAQAAARGQLPEASAEKEKVRNTVEFAIGGSRLACNGSALSGTRSSFWQFRRQAQTILYRLLERFDLGAHLWVLSGILLVQPVMKIGYVVLI